MSAKHKEGPKPDVTGPHFLLVKPRIVLLVWWEKDIAVGRANLIFIFICTGK